MSDDEFKRKQVTAKILGNGAYPIMSVDDAKFHKVVGPQERSCKWSDFDPEECTYSTSCGNSVQLIQGSVLESSYKFCPRCGKEINEDPVIEGFGGG